MSFALWVAVCAFSATLLGNFASYGAALAGYTTAIIIGDELGAVGGLNGDAFNLTVARGLETGLGTVCATAVLAISGTGGARKRLAGLLSGLSADIAAGLMRPLRLEGPIQAESRPLRHRMIGRIVGLEPVIDEAAGEIARSPFHPLVMGGAADSLFVALTAWRSMADHLEIAQGGASKAARVRPCLPPQLVDPDAIGLGLPWRSEARNTSGRRY